MANEAKGTCFMTVCRLLLPVVAVLCCLPVWTGCSTERALAKSAIVFLVRHAEKADSSSDSPLAPAGEARAVQLATLLRDAGIDTIYTTDFRRTRDTAAPLARQLQLTPTIYDWEALPALAAEIRKRGGRSLVVGHSNTTPELVQLLGGDPGTEIDEKSEYDRLYVVAIAREGAVTTTLLRYGDSPRP
jgi:2,3-bisphosphoglycerate-dependent phosphoglycerate mutase